MTESQSHPLKILKASAGSGKTFALVEVFLEIILNQESNNYYKSVLALTFTNKAAKEMKERIVDALEILSRDPQSENYDSGFVDGKVKSLGMSPDKLRERASACLNEIIHNYGNLSVMTIDKFSHKIVRSFARDLELESDFGIELNSDELKREVIAELVDEFGRNKDFTRLLFEYSKTNIDEGSVWNVSNLLFDFSKTIDNEKYEKEVARLIEMEDEEFDKIQKEIVAATKSFENQYFNIVNEFADYLNSLSTDPEEYYQKSSGIFGNINKRNKSKDVNGELLMSKAYISKCYEDRNDFSRSGGIVSAGTDKIKHYIDLLDDLLEKRYPQYSTLLGIRKSFFNIRLINKIQKTVAKLKSEKNIKELSDINKEISQIIMSESVPFIYERIGERYKHFLLDEFQDTSVRQWQNLIPLVHNGISTNEKSLIVGDAKQSIYRFRNGEVEQFISLPDIYNPTHSPEIDSIRPYFERRGLVKPMDENWRSKKEVVEFNNQFFTAFSEFVPEEYREIYTKNFEQKAKKGSGGYVEIEMREKFEEEEKLDKSLLTIQSCIEDGFDYKDICVIMRGKKEGVVISEFLEVNKIPVISEETLYVGNDLTVQFLVSILNLVAEPHSYESKSIYAEKYLETQQIDPAELIPFQSKKEYEYIFDLIGFNMKYQLPEIEELLRYDSLVELLYRIRTKYHINYEENPYVELFFELIYKYENKYSAYLNGFLEWWNEKGCEESIAIPESTNAVKMMTIHKSKGLEFPIVILPFTEWGFGDIGSKTNILWINSPDEVLDTFYVRASKPEEEPDPILKEYFEKEKNQMILDETNNLYVAFTRAVDRLYVFSDLSKSGSGRQRDWSKTKISTYIYKALGEEEKVSFGQPTKKIAKSETSTSEISLSTDIKLDKSVSFSFKPSIPNETIQYHIDYGVWLHKAMSKIQTKTDIDNMVEILSELDITKEDKERIEEDLKSLFANPEISELLFENNVEVISEKDLITEDGKVLRPDRVLLKKDEVVVVDFKTGEERKKDKKQIEEYIAILDMMGISKLEGKLLYSTSNNIISI